MEVKKLEKTTLAQGKALLRRAQTIERNDSKKIDKSQMKAPNEQSILKVGTEVKLNKKARHTTSSSIMWKKSTIWAQADIKPLSKLNRRRRHKICWRNSWRKPRKKPIENNNDQETLKRLVFKNFWITGRNRKRKGRKVVLAKLAKVFLVQESLPKNSRKTNLQIKPKYFQMH